MGPGRKKAATWEHFSVHQEIRDGELIKEFKCKYCSRTYKRENATKFQHHLDTCLKFKSYPASHSNPIFNF